VGQSQRTNGGTSGRRDPSPHLRDNGKIGREETDVLSVSHQTNGGRRGTHSIYRKEKGSRKKRIKIADRAAFSAKSYPKWRPRKVNWGKALTRKVGKCERLLGLVLIPKVPLKKQGKQKKKRRRGREKKRVSFLVHWWPGLLRWWRG